jgi:hypothetical protein
MAAVQQPDKFKFPKPIEFTKRSQNANGWLMMLDLYFISPGVVGAQLNDNHKISFALFKMGGEAEAWRGAEIRRLSQPGGAWGTWEEFKTKFRTRFGVSNEAAKALRILKGYIWQRHKKEPLGTILTTVDTLIQESGITDEEQKKSFLRQATAPDYARFLAIKQPATYTDSLTQLQNYEVELGRNSFSFGGPSSSTSNTQGPWPMDIDRISKETAINFSGRPGKKDKGKGECFKCKRTGHMAKDCYAKTNVQTGAPINATSGRTNKFKRSNKSRGNYKGKGRSKGKGKYVRGAEIRESEEEESDDQEEDQDHEETSIRYIENMRRMINEMDDGVKKMMLLALQQDFQQ